MPIPTLPGADPKETIIAVPNVAKCSDYGPNTIDYFFIVIILMVVFPFYTFAMIPALLISNDARRLRVQGWNSAAEEKGKKALKWLIIGGITVVAINVSIIIVNHSRNNEEDA